MASLNPTQEIKEKLDIVEIIRGYITLTPAGKNFKAPCPFHKEKTPSFMVSPDRQTWHCFGSCGEGGDVFSFVMKYENLEFYEVLKMLAEKAGIELRHVSPQDQKQFGILYDINDAAKTFFQEELARDASVKEYLKERGLQEATIQEFELGLAPQAFDKLTLEMVKRGFDVHDTERAGLIFKSDRGGYIDRFRGRVMFPIYNHAGKIVGFSGRILPQFEKPEIGKYVNSPETPIYNKSRVLYGFHKNKHAVKSENTAVIVEGQMDFLMAAQDGITNVVATSGTALTTDHMKTLRRLADRVVLAFDNDDAGMNAVERGIDLAHAHDFAVQVMIMENMKDPAEVAQRAPGTLKTLIEKAKGAFEFYMHRYLEARGKDRDMHELKKNIRVVLEKVKALASPIEQAHWIGEISGRTGIREEALFEELRMVKEGRHEEKKEETPKAVRASLPFPRTRREKIAERIVMLVAAKEMLRTQTQEIEEYMPLDYGIILKHIKGEHTEGGDDLVTAVGVLTLRGASAIDAMAEGKLEEEWKELCAEVRAEFLKEKRESLMQEVRAAERGGNEDETNTLLKQFDELSKLMQNRG